MSPRHAGGGWKACCTAAWLLLCVAPAAAQDRLPRVIVAVEGGSASTGEPPSQQASFTLNAETADFRAQHSVKTGGSVAVHGTVRVWQRLMLGISGTYDKGATDIAVDARLPHPLLFNRPRTVQGDLTDRDYSAAGFDARVGWLFSLTPRVTLVTTAGPSWVWLRHPVLTEVGYREVFPFNTATFTGGETPTVRGSAVGMQAGVELGWRLMSHLGLQASASLRRVDVDLEPEDQSTFTVPARRVRVRGGVQLSF